MLADQSRLKQVLLNLLANAVKYNRAGGKVKVTWNAVGAGRVRIDVTDTGVGIPAERIAELFQPFNRLGAEAMAEVEGTGLGLALSKGLVEAMGGVIRAASIPEAGSTFSVELMAVDDPANFAPVPEERRPAQVHATQGVRNILYIEDNLSNLKLLERILARRTDIRLLAAMTGRLGLELAREHRPDLILLDVHLPDLPGNEVLTHLRAQPETQQIPVVVVSADATPTQVQRPTAAGARAYLTKPLDVRKLLEVITSTFAETDVIGAGRPAADAAATE